MQCSQYFQNIFVTNPKSKLLLVKNKNFSDQFKLESVKTYHLGFVVKVLQKCCEHNTSQKLSKQTNQPKIPNQTFNCDFLNCVFKWHILKSLFFYIKKCTLLNSQSVSVYFSLQPNLLDLCDIFFQKDNAFCLYQYLFNQYIRNCMGDQ